MRRITSGTPATTRSKTSGSASYMIKPNARGTDPGSAVAPTAPPFATTSGPRLRRYDAPSAVPTVLPQRSGARLTAKPVGARPRPAFRRRLLSVPHSTGAPWFASYPARPPTWRVELPSTRLVRPRTHRRAAAPGATDRHLRCDGDRAG